MLMEKLNISNQQIREFASSCYEVIISEIKDACAAEEMDNSAVEKTEYENVA